MSSNDSLAAKLAQFPRTPNEKLIYPSHLQTVISHLAVDKRDLERRVCAARRLVEEETRQRLDLQRDRAEAEAEAKAARKRHEEVRTAHCRCESEPKRSTTRTGRSRKASSASSTYNRL